jgi:amphi-Trp domain-containing protein
MISKPERDEKRSLDRQAFVAQLRRIADALEAGEKVEIRVAGERIYVPARAEFSIEHERSDGQEELELQLRWSLKG